MAAPAAMAGAAAKAGRGPKAGAMPAAGRAGTAGATAKPGPAAKIAPLAAKCASLAARTDGVSAGVTAPLGCATRARPAGTVSASGPTYPPTSPPRWGP